MARKATFNFGANATKSKTRKSGGKKGGGGKSNAWRAYTGGTNRKGRYVGSSAPLED